MEGRGREGPIETLKDLKGYLQTDGYVAYDVFAKRQGIELIHCRAHARRMFNDALDNDDARASHALREIQKLYTIERQCKEQQLCFEDGNAVRQEKSLPVLKDLGIWLQQNYVTTLPKSAIGKAIAYSLERWARLSAYTTDGKLNIDNNPIENSIRPVALDRKIIYLPEAMKLQNAAACCTHCWGLARCMALNLIDGSKKFCKRSLSIL